MNIPIPNHYRFLQPRRRTDGQLLRFHELVNTQTAFAQLQKLLEKAPGHLKEAHVARRDNEDDRTSINVLQEEVNSLRSTTERFDTRLSAHFAFCLGRMPSQERIQGIDAALGR
jgi:hypothetical protein